MDPNYDFPWVTPPYTYWFTVSPPSSLLGWVWNDWWVAISAVLIVGQIIAILQFVVPFWFLVFATFGIAGFDFNYMDETQYSFYQDIMDSYFPLGLHVFFNPFTWEGWFWMMVDAWLTGVSFAGPLYIVKWIVFFLMYLMGEFTLTEGFEDRFNWYNPLKVLYTS